MASAADSLKKVFLELGGKSASVVLDDADLGTACFMTALNTCTHAGQGCALTTRLLVPREKYAEAVESAKGAMASFAPTDPNDPGAFCGPVISAAQRERIEGYIALAAREGGTIEIGGGRPTGEGFDRGFWVEPTLISGLDNSARVAQEEIFGPVLVIIPHDGDADAIRIANDSPYGLSGAGHRPGARREGRVRHPHRHPRRQRRPVVRRGRSVRRLQAVRHRPRDGPCGLRGVSRDQVRRHPGLSRRPQNPQHRNHFQEIDRHGTFRRQDSDRDRRGRRYR